MVESKPSLASLFFPQLQEGWSLLLASPWLSVVFILLTLISVRRHGELAYGTYHAGPVGLLLVATYLGAQVLMGVSATNLGFFAALLLVILSDSVVLSLSSTRTPYFVYNIGVVLGLLFLIHPLFLLLSIFYIGKLRMIKSATARHITAYLLGHLTMLSLATMLFAARSWEGIVDYWQSWMAPLLQMEWPEVWDFPVLILDTAYLGTLSIGLIQTTRTSTVRVRLAMTYHLQLAWVLMLMHLVGGLQGQGHYSFLLGVLFLTGVMVDYLLTLKRSQWLLMPLLVILTVAVGVRVWLYLGQPTLG